MKRGKITEAEKRKIKMKKHFLALISLMLIAVLCSCNLYIGDLGDINVTVNEVFLEDYSLVYDSDSIYARFAAENLRDRIIQKYSIALPVLPDTENETRYEILLGDTCRITTDDDTGVGLSDDRYTVKTNGDKILLIARGYMIGGAARGFIDICDSAELTRGTRRVTVEEVTETYEYREARGALLYIGDGMGENHIKWAISEGMSTFCPEDMPYHGKSMTYSYSVKPLCQNEFTDSAAGATALATGYKTLNGVLGMDHEYEPLLNIRELARFNGAKTAVLTTDNTSGATPSAFVLHCSSRFDTAEIERQITELEISGGINVYEGNLGDGLLTASQNALNIVTEDNTPFFMMLEEGDIDLCSHGNDRDGMFRALNRFNEAVANAMQFTLVRGDVLFIVTADHETGGITENGDGFSFTSTDHTNSDVRIFAMGDGAEFFDGKTVENVLIPHRMARVFNVDSFGDSNFQ